jgi:hypothetical protein
LNDEWHLLKYYLNQQIEVNQQDIHEILVRNAYVHLRQDKYNQPKVQHEKLDFQMALLKYQQEFLLRVWQVLLDQPLHQRYWKLFNLS